MYNIISNDMFGCGYIVPHILFIVNGGNMKSEKRIFTAFILNLLFSVFELVGGIFTGSVAIMSDSLHDLGDALSIGISYLLEKKSKKEADRCYTFGYARYSVLGGLITAFILFIGSCAVIYNAIRRMLNPVDINYNGMLLLAIIGVTVNLAAAYFTHGGHSVNQRAVNLHMLEDVLGWVVVLIGAIIMRFTDIAIIDPLMSVAVAIFILINCVKTLKEIFDIFLEKAPNGYNTEEIKSHIMTVADIDSIPIMHLWTLDGVNHYAVMHIVTKQNYSIKEKIRAELAEHGIFNSFIELHVSLDSCPTEAYTQKDKHTHHHH